MWILYSSLQHTKKLYQSLVALCVVIVLFLVFSCRDKILSQIYPFLETAEYSAVLTQEGSNSDAQPYLVPNTNGAFLKVLSKTKITPCSPSLQMPPVAFEIHVFQNKSSYRIVVGCDNTISVANLKDLTNSRRFFKDYNKTVFQDLYQVYLKYGGSPL